MKKWTLVMVAGALVQWSAGAIAQTYPAKPVRLIVPTAPGGGTDLIGRLLAQSLSGPLGQQVLVDNRGGAGTTIGSALTAKAPPDGYTLLLNHTSLAFNASFYDKLPYDTLNDFAPVSILATQPFILAVHPSLPVKSAADLVSLARSRPGQIAYASGGAGSGPYMGAALLQQSAKVDILHVPYKGAGPAFTDLMAGQVQMMIATVSVVLPHVKTGRVRALAVTSAKRITVAPELPTVGESAVPGYEYSAWYGLFAPAATPTPIVTRLNDETVKVMRAPDLQERFAASGLEALSSSPEAFKAHFEREVQKWARVAKAVGAAR